MMTPGKVLVRCLECKKTRVMESAEVDNYQKCECGSTARSVEEVIHTKGRFVATKEIRRKA